MEKLPRLKALCSWPTIVGIAIGAFGVAFVVYPPAVGWGASEKWGDIPGWLGVVGAFVAAGITIWAVLASIEASRTATVTAFTLRHLDSLDRAEQAAALKKRLALMFRNELFLLGGMYAHFRDELSSALVSKDMGEMRHAFERGIPTQGLRLIERFAGDLYVFPSDTAVHVAQALTRWYSYQQAPSVSEVPEVRLADSVGVTISSLQRAIYDLRVAHAELKPFLPENVLISEDEAEFSDLSKDY